MSHKKLIHITNTMLQLIAPELIIAVKQSG